MPCPAAAPPLQFAKPHSKQYGTFRGERYYSWAIKPYKRAECSEILIVQSKADLLLSSFSPSLETPTLDHGRKQNSGLTQLDTFYSSRRVSKGLESYLHNLLSWLCLLKLLQAKAGLEHA